MIPPNKPTTDKTAKETTPIAMTTSISEKPFANFPRYDLAKTFFATGIVLIFLGVFLHLFGVLEKNRAGIFSDFDTPPPRKQSFGVF